MGDFFAVFLFTTFLVVVFGVIPRALWRKYSAGGKKRVEEEKRQHEERWKRINTEMGERRSKQQKIICKLCGEKGGVTSMSHVEKDETREKGVIGATIGRKTVTKRNVRKYSCSNCGESWTVG